MELSTKIKHLDESNVIHKVSSMNSKQMLEYATIYRRGKRKDVDHAITLYNASIAKSLEDDNIHPNVGLQYLELGTILKHGEGKNAIPDVEKATSHFLKSIENGYESAILEIADMFMYGLHPYFLPDKLDAVRIFEHFSKDKRTSESFKRICFSKLRELYQYGYSTQDNVPIIGQNYVTLQYDILDACLKAWQKSTTIYTIQPVTNTILTPSSQIVKHHPQSRANIQEIHVEYHADPLDDINQQHAMWNDITHQNDIHRTRNPEIAVTQNLPNYIVNDSQNVHGPSVQNSATNILRIIENENTSLSSFDQLKYDFINTIKTINNKPEEIQLAIQVIESLNDAIHSRYERSEQDVFKLIWSRINHPINSNRKDDLKKILIHNLASSIEHGKLVCSTGKIMRIIGTLDGMDAGDNIPLIKPEWAINQEIAEAAAKIREDVLKEANEIERNAYNSIDDNTNNEAQQKLSKLMQTQLIQKCTIDYVTSGIISSADLDNKLKIVLENL